MDFPEFYQTLLTPRSEITRRISGFQKKLVELGLGSGSCILPAGGSFLLQRDHVQRVFISPGRGRSPLAG